jgi:hypothetical protein
MEDYEDLVEGQRVAHLVFWYDSEVQNGGHLQYFRNPAGRHAGEAIAALREVGAEEQSSILGDAIKRWDRGPRPRIETPEEFVAADQALFADLDSCFHDSDPSIHQCLERYLDDHESLFIEYTDAV